MQEEVIGCTPDDGDDDDDDDDDDVSQGSGGDRHRPFGLVSVLERHARTRQLRWAERQQAVLPSL